MGAALITLVGVVFTTVRNGRTAAKAAENEERLNRFEEQDRMLLRERERADRAEQREAAANARADAADARAAEAIARAVAAERVIVKWNLKREDL
jgi:hypothetical protein